jgi:type II secretory pathway pseudopilin PulG
MYNAMHSAIGMAAKESADKSAKSGKGHRKRWIALIVVLVILGVLAYLYEMYGSLPTMLISVLSSGKQLNSTTMEGAMLQKLNATKTLAASYSGQITFNSDPSANFSFTKYYGDIRVAFSASGIPAFGNVSAIFVTSNTSAHGTLCIKTSSASIFDMFNSSNVTDGYKCMQTYNTSAREQLFRVADIFVNLSSLSYATLKSYGISFYNGQPCYSASGSGSIEVNSTLVGGSSSTQTPVNAEFSTCLSAQYSIPLYISANLTAANGSSIRVRLNESSMSQTTTASEATALPGS